MTGVIKYGIGILALSLATGFQAIRCTPGDDAQMITCLGARTAELAACQGWLKHTTAWAETKARYLSRWLGIG